MTGLTPLGHNAQLPPFFGCWSVAAIAEAVMTEGERGGDIRSDVVGRNLFGCGSPAHACMGVCPVVSPANDQRGTGA